MTEGSDAVVKLGSGILVGGKDGPVVIRGVRIRVGEVKSAIEVLDGARDITIADNELVVEPGFRGIVLEGISHPPMPEGRLVRLARRAERVAQRLALPLARLSRAVAWVG